MENNFRMLVLLVTVTSSYYVPLLNWIRRKGRSIFEINNLDMNIILYEENVSEGAVTSSQIDEIELIEVIYESGQNSNEVIIDIQQNIDG